MIMDSTACFTHSREKTHDPTDSVLERLDAPGQVPAEHELTQSFTQHVNSMARCSQNARSKMLETKCSEPSFRPLQAF